MEAGLTPQRALFAYRSDVDLRGGAAIMLGDLADALRALGVEVDVSVELEPDPRGYDLVHVFNIWAPGSALHQLRHLRSFGVPIVWNPIYSHWAEVAWARPAIAGIFGVQDPAERQRYLDAFASGDLEVGHLTRWRFNEIVPGFHALLREMLDSVDHVLVFSSREMQMLSQVTRLAHKPFTVVPHGLSLDLVDRASPEDFRRYAGVEDDFVLSVGTLNAHKNQLMLVEALKGTGVKVVLVGSCFEPEYLELCRREGGNGLAHFDHLPRELVASAYKAAAAHVLASFAEGAAQVNLEAAAAGCPVVVSNRSSEYEYFGDLAFYCDPTSSVSIREAALAALEGRQRDPHRWAVLADRLREHTWERAGLAVLGAYERTLAAHARAARRGARERVRLEARDVVVASSVEEMLAQPELLAAWRGAFTAADPVTLVLGACELPLDEAASRLSPLASAQGLDEPDAPDVCLVALGVDALAQAADYLFATRLAPGARVPRFEPGDLDALVACCRETGRLAWAASPRPESAAETAPATPARGTSARAGLAA